MRLLHTMIRVGDLDRSIAFYTDVLGMTLLRKHDYPDGKFTLAFVGYGPESQQAAIELTYNYGASSATIKGTRSATSHWRWTTPTLPAKPSGREADASCGRRDR